MNDRWGHDRIDDEYREEPGLSRALIWTLIAGTVVVVCIVGVMMAS